MSETKTFDTFQARNKIRVSVEEAAILLTMHPRTLREKMANQTGPVPIRDGKRTLFLVKELERWADAQMEAS
jgi:uncharacterized protein (UPF0216 family)